MIAADAETFMRQGHTVERRHSSIKIADMKGDLSQNSQSSLFDLDF